LVADCPLQRLPQWTACVRRLLRNFRAYTTGATRQWQRLAAATLSGATALNSMTYAALLMMCNSCRTRLQVGKDEKEKGFRVALVAYCC
jgi:hypothetical protein